MKTMPKILFISLALSSVMLADVTEELTKDVTQAVKEVKTNINTAVEEGRVIGFYATTGYKTLERDNSNPNLKFEVEPLLEVEAGLVLLPDSYKITLGYKTAVNSNNETDTLGEDSSSDASSTLFNIELLSSEKWGYINFDYQDVSLNGKLTNVGNGIFIVSDKVGPYFGYYGINPRGTIATEEKITSTSIVYRNPWFSNIGIIASKVKRELPMAIPYGTNYSFLVQSAKGSGNAFGAGYFNDFKYVKENGFFLKELSYIKGSVDDASESDVLGNTATANFDTEVLCVELAYKYNDFTIALGMKEVNITMTSFSSTAVAASANINETYDSVTTSLTLGMRF